MHRRRRTAPGQANDRRYQGRPELISQAKQMRVQAWERINRLGTTKLVTLFGRSGEAQRALVVSQFEF